MAKQARNNGYRHNEEDILKACGLTKRDPVLRETFDFLVDAINSTEENSRRIELLESFLRLRNIQQGKRPFCCITSSKEPMIQAPGIELKTVMTFVHFQKSMNPESGSAMHKG